MKRYFLLLLVLIFVKTSAGAQIVPDLFFKSWDLSYINPAALTQAGGLKGNVQYNVDMMSGVNTAKGGLLQLHSDLGGKHGLGIQLQNQGSGVLAGNGVGAGYGYRVQLQAEHSLSLGARFNYFKYSINRAEITNANTSDPVLYGDAYRQSNILLTSGLFYQWKDLQVAVTVPELLPMESANYYRKNFSGYVGYTFRTPEGSFRPNFYYEQVAALGGWYEMSLYGSYQDVLSLELSHTSESAVRVKAGLKHRAFDLGYGFDSGSPISTERQQKMGHRLYLAYNFGQIGRGNNSEK
jgi:type IX secretion system PorP/SprF family membrane protein